jgi:hypothetical protein
MQQSAYSNGKVIPIVPSRRKRDETEKLINLKIAPDLHIFTL